MEQELNPEMVENFITPKLSSGSDDLEIVRKLANKRVLNFVLTKSFSIFISDKIHQDIRQNDGIKFEDEMTYGRFYSESKDVILQDDLAEKKQSTKILKPILYKKILGFLQPYFEQARKNAADLEY